MATAMIKKDNNDIKTESEITKTPKKKTFKKNEAIPCRSVTVGELWLTGSKSKEVYSWSEYGDVTDVEYQDLASMARASRNDYIYGPLFIIDDDDFVEEFPSLKKFYNEKYSVKELKGILDINNVRTMISTIDKLPDGAKNTIKSIASTQVGNGRLDSIKKIKALDEYFGTELNLIQSVVQ